MAENAFKADWPSFALGFNTGKSKGGSGGGVELNIAYGETPPEDTSKLWAKTSPPKKVLVSKNTEKMVGEIGELDRASVSASINSYMSRTGYATIGKKIYTAGGKGFITKVHSYDVANKKLVIEASLPTAAQYVSVAAVGNSLYIFGGHRSGGGLNTIHVLDTENGNFALLDQKLPFDVMQAAAASVGTKIYLFGGDSFANANSKTMVLRFDTETYEVAQLDPLPENRYIGMTPVVSGNKIYLLGGSPSNSMSAVDTILCFDVDTEKTTVAEEVLPYPLSQPAYTVFGDNVFMFGGNISKTSSYNITRDVCVFNAATKESAVLKNALSQGAYSAICGTVDETMYFYGGINVNGAALSKVFSFVPYRTVLPNGSLQVIPSETANSFLLLNTPTIQVEAGTSKVYKGNSEDRGDIIEAAVYKDGEWVTI